MIKEIYYIYNGSKISTHNLGGPVHIYRSIYLNKISNMEYFKFFGLQAFLFNLSSKRFIIWIVQGKIKKNKNLISHKSVVYIFIYLF